MQTKISDSTFWMTFVYFLVVASYAIYLEIGAKIL